MSALEKFKSAFHTSGPLRHFNNAGISPAARPAIDEVTQWLRRFHEDGAFCIAEANACSEAARDELALFVGAGSHQLAFFPNTAAALSQVALGFKLNPGDEIIVWDQEYPSNFYPWKFAADRAGAKLVIAPCGSNLETPASRLLERITPRTRMIAFSWVQYRSGAITDVRAVTREARTRGILTCADIIQGTGVLPFDFRGSGLDAACGGSHKWLASFPGVGFLCLRDEHIANVAPLCVGALSFGSWDDLANPRAKMKTDMSKFEPGAKDFMNQIALGASVRLFRETGLEMIAAEAERLASALIRGLQEKGYEIHSPHGDRHRGAIVNFGPGKHSKAKTVAEITQTLMDHNVAFAPRPPGIRMSPHAFNRDSEIESILRLF